MDINNAFMEFDRTVNSVALKAMASPDFPREARAHLMGSFLAEYGDTHPIFYADGARASFDSQQRIISRG